MDYSINYYYLKHNYIVHSIIEVLNQCIKVWTSIFLQTMDISVWENKILTVCNTYHYFENELSEYA